MPIKKKAVKKVEKKPEPKVKPVKKEVVVPPVTDEQIAAIQEVPIEIAPAEEGVQLVPVPEPPRQIVQSHTVVRS